ncbi:uncharacterized protein O3C94_016410 [Discoglossus pictus]
MAMAEVNVLNHALESVNQLHIEEQFSFDDVVVYFSKEEWEYLNEEQKELYKEVTLENYQTLRTLGFITQKPSIVSMIERGEEPYLPDPRPQKENNINTNNACISESHIIIPKVEDSFENGSESFTEKVISMDTSTEMTNCVTPTTASDDNNEVKLTVSNNHPSTEKEIPMDTSIKITNCVTPTTASDDNNEVKPTVSNQNPSTEEEIPMDTSIIKSEAEPAEVNNTKSLEKTMEAESHVNTGCADVIVTVAAKTNQGEEPNTTVGQQPQQFSLITLTGPVSVPTVFTGIGGQPFILVPQPSQNKGLPVIKRVGCVNLAPKTGSETENRDHPPPTRSLNSTTKKTPAATSEVSVSLKPTSEDKLQEKGDRSAKEKKGKDPVQDSAEKMNQGQQMKKNCVQAILANPPKTISEICCIRDLGPDRPALNLNQSTIDKNKPYIRRFNRIWYDRKAWICGCATTNALFCFPCLILGGDSLWSKRGVTDLKHLSDKVKKHDEGKSHILNCLKLQIMGHSDIPGQTTEDHLEAIRKHNQEVDCNRHILGKIIDCIRFCGTFELALQGCNDFVESTNDGVFLNLVNLMASTDLTMEKQLHSDFINGLIGSHSVRNELLDCMLKVARDYILQELKCAEFAAIQVNDTTDVSSDIHNVIIYRYINRSGSPVERFFGFTPHSSAQTVAEKLLQELNVVFPEEKDKQKLISQSYDGMVSRSGGVCEKIQEWYPNAFYVHDPSHELTLIIQQAVSQFKEVKQFFSALSSIEAFFSRSRKRIEVFVDVVTTMFPRSLTINWHSNLWTVHLVSEYRYALIEYFKKIRLWNFDFTTIRESKILLQMLEDDGEFLYFLMLFNKLMHPVFILSTQFQQKDATPHFVSSICAIKNLIKEIRYKLTEQSQLKGNTNFDNLDQIALHVCDIVITDVRERFAFTKHKVTAKLVQCDSFSKYDRSFPVDLLLDAVDNYPVLQKERLMSELFVVYERKEFSSLKDSSILLHTLLDKNLQDCLGETVKLLRIVLTTPGSTAEPRPSVPTWKKVKTFLRNTHSEEMLNALAMLCIEKKMIDEIPDFNSQTIELFANKREHQKNFIYRR